MKESAVGATTGWGLLHLEADVTKLYTASSCPEALRLLAPDLRFPFVPDEAAQDECVIRFGV